MDQTTNRQIIAVDIDEVLSPLHSVLLLHHNAVYGTNYQAPDPFGRYFLNQITNDPEETALKKLKFFVEGKDFQVIKPLEGAVSALEKLSVKYDLIIITARQDFYEELTYEWLEKYFPKLFRSVHFTAHIMNEGPKVPKSAIAKQLGVQYLIDDNLDIVTDAARVELKVVLFGEYPWNKADELPNGVVRCSDWPTVLEYFDA